MLKDEMAHAQAEQQKKQSQAQVNKYFAEALILHRRGKLDDAWQLYRLVLQQIPSHADALNMSGVVAYQRADFPQAEELIRRSLQSNPDNAHALNNLASVLLGSGRLEEAHICVQEALKRKSDYAEAHNNLGNIYKEQSRQDEAVHAYRQATTLMPNLAEAWNNLALIYQKQKKLDAATQCAERAVVLQPNLADIHNSLGNIYKDAGRTAQAIASYQQALTLDPQLGNAQHFLHVLSGQLSAQAPVSYVSKVFDDYADRFDQHLQQVLEYKIPSLIAQELKPVFASSPVPWRVLDLGCGTGLVGQELAPFISYLVGVDLSEKMLLKAQDRQIYHRLVQSDLISMTHQEPSTSYHLVTAADVFVYLGQLDQIMAEISRLLPAGGIFCFSVEADNDVAPSSAGYCLRASGRYAHQLAYLQKLAMTNGFTEARCLPQTIRMENHQPIPGYLLIWQKQA
ncbi:tetratricopeptide repeat protein [Undibacterium sp. TS12]|nr:tetratricopeptide repeat protein [Undibacterium sp. TS12]